MCFYSSLDASVKKKKTTTFHRPREVDAYIIEMLASVSFENSNPNLQKVTKCTLFFTVFNSLMRVLWVLFSGSSAHRLERNKSLQEHKLFNRFECTAWKTVFKLVPL